MMNLVPFPKKIVVEEGDCSLSFPLRLQIDGRLGMSVDAVRSVCPGAFTITDEKGDIFFSIEENLKEKYRIQAGPHRVNIFCSGGRGAFWALITLWQIYLSGSRLCRFTVEDFPDLENRGFMLDISRGKVPTVETIKKLIDILARFKYNQLQLYVEGFSFYYPSFSACCDPGAALTAEEIREIDSYCRERFLELVPNQNSLGHMAAWLARDEFSHLAECEGGFREGSFDLPATTLDASDEASVELIKEMVSDLLPCFTSRRVHMGLDEAFEMGRGKNKGKDLAELFTGYVKKLDIICKNHGRKMMMWADGIHKYNCFGQELPRDIIYLEWGYEREYPFDARCRRLKEAGLDFYVCPGTGSWLSFTGLMENALENIDKAIEAAAVYGAKGVLLADWGDCGHMQPLPVSYGAAVYCGALGWNRLAGLSREQLEQALNLYVFQDASKRMGKIAVDAGNYYLEEEFRLPCRTVAHLFYSGKIRSRKAYEESLRVTSLIISILAPREISESYLPVVPEVNPACADRVLELVKELRAALAGTDMRCQDAELVRAEYDNALAMVGLFTQCRIYIGEGMDLSGLRIQAEEIAGRHRENWRKRNKTGGLEEGLAPFEIFAFSSGMD